MQLILIMEKEIVNITKPLKPKNSTDYGNISSKIIKYCVIAISKPLSHTFNYSLQLGTYHERLQYSVVRPIYIKKR
jgi:hypothetical protein